MFICVSVHRAGSAFLHGTGVLVTTVHLLEKLMTDSIWGSPVLMQLRNIQ